MIVYVTGQAAVWLWLQSREGKRVINANMAKARRNVKVPLGDEYRPIAVER
jgi:hypothetical protein